MGRPKDKYTAKRNKQGIWIFKDIDGNIIREVRDAMWLRQMHEEYIKDYYKRKTEHEKKQGKFDPNRDLDEINLGFIEFEPMAYKHRSKFMIALVLKEVFGNFNEIKANRTAEQNEAIKSSEVHQMYYDKALNDYYKPLDNHSYRNMQEGKKKAYKREYALAGQRNKTMFEAEMNRYDSICNILEDLTEYKNLNKVLKTYRVHLSHLIQFGKDQLIKNEKLQFKGKEKYSFSVSTRFFADHLTKNGVKSNYKNIAKMFNLFSLLGFVTKEFDEADRLYKNEDDNAYNITYLSVSQLDLMNAEKTATKLIDNGYKFQNFSGKFVLEVFGGEIYDNVFAKPKKVETINEGTTYKVNIVDEKVEVIRLSDMKDNRVEEICIEIEDENNKNEELMKKQLDTEFFEKYGIRPEDDVPF